MGTRKVSKVGVPLNFVHLKFRKWRWLRCCEPSRKEAAASRACLSKLQHCVITVVNFIFKTNDIIAIHVINKC